MLDMSACPVKVKPSTPNRKDRIMAHITPRVVEAVRILHGQAAADQLAKAIR